MSFIEAKLAELGAVLPTAAAPLAAYVPAVQSGKHLFTSGQLPVVDGELLRRGKVGRDLTADEAADLARICALNALAAIKELIGDLDRITRIVKVVGFVASEQDFSELPTVLDGASHLLQSVFGESGVHSRTAVGVSVLPLHAPIELELIVAVSDESD